MSTERSVTRPATNHQLAGRGRGRSFKNGRERGPPGVPPRHRPRRQPWATRSNGAGPRTQAAVFAPPARPTDHGRRGNRLTVGGGLTAHRRRARLPRRLGGNNGARPPPADRRGSREPEPVPTTRSAARPRGLAVGLAATSRPRRRLARPSHPTTASARPPRPGTGTDVGVTGLAARPGRPRAAPRPTVLRPWPPYHGGRTVRAPRPASSGRVVVAGCPNPGDGFMIGGYPFPEQTSEYPQNSWETRAVVTPASLMTREQSLRTYPRGPFPLPDMRRLPPATRRRGRL